jgi:benzodiazapine receptor
MTPSSDKRLDLAVLAGLLALSLAVAGVSAAATIQNVETWYAALAKPPFNPPNWLFGPVWSLLYIAMAIAAWRVWRTRGEAPAGMPLSLYAVQMTLNFAWSLLFFGAHRIGVAMIDILSLIVLLAATTAVFWKRDAAAGLLMAPYLAWVSFAAILNVAIWRLN